MPSDETLSLEQMREERNTASSTFIKFVDCIKYFYTHVFCFYEGEDGKYYNSRIRQQFGDDTITFSVGNKKEVLKLLDRIKDAGMYDNVCTMFFVDRDYDVSIAGTNEDLFETPCYSIENLYVQKECLIKILQSEFGLNKMDEDCKKCLRDFELRETEFNERLLEFNSLVYLRRKKSDLNSDYSFGSIKTSHLVNVNVKKISRSAKYDEIINDIKDSLHFIDEEIEEAKTELMDKGSCSLNFRGKNQLDFFVEFINELKRLNSAGGYFSIKRTRIRINITANRLSELSQYASTPSSLIEFLEKHKNKFLAISAC